MTLDNLCANCRLPFGSSLVVREIMIEMESGGGRVESSSRGKKRYRSVSVKYALSSIYKLDFLDNFKYQDLQNGDQDKEDDERSKNCDFGICCTCSNHLTNIFKHHRQFTERQARGSFVARRMNKLDQVLDDIVTSTTSVTPEAVKTEQNVKLINKIPVDGLLLHDDGITSAKAPLTEPECLKKSKILKIVMKFLSNSDLKSCRLVTKPWLRSSTFTLLSRQALETRLCYSGKENSYIQSGSGHPIDDQLIEERPTLELLMECIAKSESKSTNFPSTQFHFTGGTLSSSDAQNFFFAVGAKITHLSLSSTQMNTLWKILTQLPNLEKLTIASHIDYYKIGKSSAGVFFPSIKCIEFGPEFKSTKSVQALEKLLPACFNLQLIEGAWHVDVELLIRTRTIHTVKTWASDSMTNVEQLFKFALKEPQLKEFVINDATKYQGTVAEMLRANLKILNSSWTLEKLTVAQVLYESGKTFPESLVRLKHLALQSTNHKEGERYFPMGINLDKTFPKLKILTFLPNNNNYYGSEMSWENIFPSPIKTGNGFIGRFSSVTTLNLTDSGCSLNFLRVLHDLCPKVSNLNFTFFGSPTTNNNNSIADLFPEICRLFQLKTLELKFGNILPNLDDLIIGFSSEICLGEEPWNFESIKRKPWIGDIKDFKNFRISFSADAKEHHPRIPFTKISGLGAFKLMPDLAVSVQCKINKGSALDSELQLALDSISLYATIVVDSV